MYVHKAGKIFDHVDASVTRWMRRNGCTLLRLAMGIVFLWFGGLKLLDGLSPAEGLIQSALPMFPLRIATHALGIWEVLIGMGLLTNKGMRLALLLVFLLLPGTLGLAVLIPNQIFTLFPFGLTFAGQYIVKDLVLASAGIVLGAQVRAESANA